MKKYIILITLLFSIFSLSAQIRKTKVACVGNSVTYGYLLPEREKNCYPSKLQELLGSKYEVKNFGKSGATLLSKGHRPYINQMEYENALNYSPDIIIIHLGLNDTDPRNWPNYKDEFFKDYTDLIESFRKANKEAEIWICQISPITYKHPRFKSGTRDWYRQIQETIKDVAIYNNLGLIDLEKPLYNRPDLLPDALHPNIEGAEIIANTVYSALTGNYGGLKLPEIYSDNMVLQRNVPINIKGTANAGEQITVNLDGKEKTATTCNDGKWHVTFAPLKENIDITLEIKSPEKSFKFKNVAVGEVWLCSGQSNMAFPLSSDFNFKEIADSLNNPNIRLFNMKPSHETNNVEWDSLFLDSINSLNHFKKTNWIESNNKDASSFSAIAYYFGKTLNDSLNIPIGLIHNAVGGSPLESWIDRNSLESEFPEILTDWKNNDFIQEWARERAKKNIKKSTKPDQRHPYEPAYLFESGIEPLASYPIAGVIWYQGESNAHNLEAYEKLFPLFIQSWRTNWDNDNLPFYYVQLSSINRPSWPQFRDSQRKMMEYIPDIYMTVSSDKGDFYDVHPIYKKPIGERLAKSALNSTYHKINVTPSGPLFNSAKFIGPVVIVNFDYADGLQTSDNKEINGFELAEIDGLYFPAEAEVINNVVRIWSDSVKNPKYIRYGWQPFTKANLINSDELPASTFKTDNKIKSNTMKTKLEKLDNYPIGGGVSGGCAGVSKNNLIVVGGCNFPNKPVVEGGEKVFYDEIYSLSLENTKNKWQKMSNLPYKVAYGAYVVYNEKLICIGGQNDEGLINKVVGISFNKNKNDVSIENLPDLPVGLFNAGATIIGSHVYVVGGKSSDKKQNKVYALNLDNTDEGWITIKTNLSADREQPVVFSQGDKLLIGGGYNEENAIAYTDVLEFNFKNNKWTEFSKIEIDGSKTTFVGTGYVNMSSNKILFLGGVNEELFTSALQRIKNKKAAEAKKDRALEEKFKKQGQEYMLQKPEWYKFSKFIISFDSKSMEWEVLGSFNQLAKAGAAVTRDKNNIYVICGELKPGIRTQESFVINMGEF